MRDGAQDSTQELDLVSNQATVDTTSIRDETRPPSQRTSRTASRATTPAPLSARPHPSSGTASAHGQQLAAPGPRPRRQARGEQDLMDLRHDERDWDPGAATAGGRGGRPLAELLRDLERRPPAQARDKMRDDIERLERRAKRNRAPSLSSSSSGSGGEGGRAGPRGKRPAKRPRSPDTR